MQVCSHYLTFFHVCMTSMLTMEHPLDFSTNNECSSVAEREDMTRRRKACNGQLARNIVVGSRHPIMQKQSDQGEHTRGNRDCGE